MEERSTVRWRESSGVYSKARREKVRRREKRAEKPNAIYS